MLLIMDKDKNKWKEITQEEKKAMSKEEQNKTLYIHPREKKKLDFAIKQQKNDNDVVGIVAGDEGSGKSNKAGNMMRYVSMDKFDPKLDMIGADYDDALNKIKNAKKGSYLMFDEGNIFFLSTEVMKRENRDLHKIFSIFRQKNLFVVIVLPSYFRLNSYFAIDRSKFLIRTYLKGGKRGYYSYHGNKRKANLYKYGMKHKDYNATMPNFRGRFSVCYPLENEEYKKFKLSTLNRSILGAVEKKKVIHRKDIEIQRNKEIIKLNMDMKTNKLGKMIGISGRRIRQLKLEMKNDEITKK